MAHPQFSSIPLSAHIILWAWRFVFLMLAAAAAAALAAQFGTPIGLAIWAGTTGVACATSALLLRAAPLGQFTWRNRLAGILLTSGARLGRGKLWSMTAVAWAVWVAVGAAAVVLMPLGGAGRVGLAILLFAAWVFYGSMVLRQVGYVLNEFRNSPSGRRTMLMMTAVMIALITASATAWLNGQHTWAVTIGAGPIAIIGGGYCLTIGALMVAARGRSLR